MKIAARMRRRKATPPITPPMIAFLECDVEVEVGGEAEDDIVSGARALDYIFLVEVWRYRVEGAKGGLEREEYCMRAVTIHT
jgi:hypothetical protein